ncbi:LRC43 protein, partial [Pomatorhinus ruficollis]|nr:LRC43 protein [Pomatorhinus ruficollis]
PSSVSAAFQEYLQHLGLQDFPCGFGSWVGVWGGTAVGHGTGLPLPVLSPCLQNKSRLHGRRSPWVEPARLEEAPPQDVVLIRVTQMSRRSTHVHVTLATRYHRDKSAKPSSLQVEEVVEGLLRFQQLEELILSANNISRVPSAHLPRTLKVLELCCNAVDDLQDLCARPPPGLQHLGLGYNRLCGPSQEKHLSVEFWPNLVSLDLSFNSLTDLLELVSQLSTLQNLHILVLQGNPLALIPTYRGFLVDSLPKLSILDDIHIWPEEREQFHGLA